MDAVTLAAELLKACVSDEQAVRRVPADDEAAAVRREVRRLARADGVTIRTARIGDTVAVVRTDAQIWRDDTATMRRKLALS